MKPRNLYRVRRHDHGQVRETRFYLTATGAEARAMRWRGYGYDVDVSVSTSPPTWRHLWGDGTQAGSR
jgi:hypothetical protein